MSLSEEYDKKTIVDDLQMNQRVEAIVILNYALSAITGFYEVDIPNSVYKLLSQARLLIDPDIEFVDF